MVVWVGAGLSQASGVPPPPTYDRLRFLRDSQQGWRDYEAWRARLVECGLNAGHAALQRAQCKHPKLRIVTLNQDGLLQRAGCEVLELHGSVWETRCLRCGGRGCECGGGLRPDLVWPGEDLPEGQVEQALQWLRECDCLISVATSGRAAPAGEFPLRARQAYRLEINLAETLVSAHHDECWRGPAEELLERL